MSHFSNSFIKDLVLIGLITISMMFLSRIMANTFLFKPINTPVFTSGNFQIE